MTMKKRACVRKRYRCRTRNPVRQSYNGKFPDVSIEMYPFDSTYAIHLDDTSHRHFTSQGIPYKVVSDPSETEFPWAKAMFDAEGISQEVQAFMRENFDDPAFCRQTADI